MTLAVALGLAFSSCRASAQEKLPEVDALLPARTVAQQRMSLSAGEDEAIGVAYTVSAAPEAPFHTGGVRVFSKSPNGGWEATFDETDTRMGRFDKVRFEKLRSPAGKEALLVVKLVSGVGTTTDWYVLTAVDGKIVKLPSEPKRAKVLTPLEYVDKGYNSVRAEGGSIVETLPGYTSPQARCCPNRPSLEMRFNFTGASIVFDSLKELPYGQPKTGSYGPLLRLQAHGLWAYGYALPDGFLALEWAESPTEHEPSTPKAIVDLRNRLRERGVLFDNGDRLVLTENYKFASPMIAAAVLLGRPAEASEWKDEDGKPLAER